MVMALTRQDVQDLYLVQASLAGELAARAAARITPLQLAELEALQVILEEAKQLGDVEQIEVLNHQFHRAINLVADSPKLAWFLSSAVRYAPRRFYPTIHGWPEASVEDHHVVLKALRLGDVEAAKTAMHEHIQHAGDLLVAHLEETQRW
jgi:DNA-binding GntR family transcriptional regulator